MATNPLSDPLFNQVFAFIKTMTKIGTIFYCVNSKFPPVRAGSITIGKVQLAICLVTMAIFKLIIATHNKIDAFAL